MLNLLDESLEAFLRAQVPLPARDIDVSFAAPDKDWGAGVTRPTVNLFLWDVRRNVAEREAGISLQEAGRRLRRPPLPRVDCRYLVTAWTSETQDEHALLGAVLTTLLLNAEIAAEHLQGSYAGVRPVPSLSMAADGDDDQSDFWSALGGQLKPGLDLTVTATVDAATTAAAGPPVFRYRTTLTDSSGASSQRDFAGGIDERPEAAGARVRSTRGSAYVAADGTFLVPAVPGDAVVVDTEPPARRKVPESGPVRVGRGRR